MQSQTYIIYPDSDMPDDVLQKWRAYKTEIIADPQTFFQTMQRFLMEQTLAELDRCEGGFVDIFDASKQVKGPPYGYAACSIPSDAYSLCFYNVNLWKADEMYEILKEVGYFSLKVNSGSPCFSIAMVMDGFNAQIKL